MRALAVTVSNRAAAGIYEDRSGPVLAGLLRSAGCSAVDGPLVVPDGDPVEAALREAVAGERRRKEAGQEAPGGERDKHCAWRRAGQQSGRDEHSQGFASVLTWVM